jgi:trypsin
MRASGKAALAAGVMLLLGACSSVTDAPDETSGPSLITFGTPDPGHPYVGAVLFRRGDDFFSCTGTLLSSTVMLTAGHCVEESGQLNDATYVRFTQDALAGRDKYPTLQKWLDAKWIRAKRVIAHPQFDDFSQFPNTYDVGLVILPKPGVSLSTYGALPEEGLLESLSGQNKLFTAVGYGMQGLIKPFLSDIFARFQGTTRLIEVKSTFTGDSQSAKFTNNPGQGGGTCFGDSGGPIFVGTTNVIGAITSFGITPCIGVDFNFRIDTETSLNFIRQYLR